MFGCGFDCFRDGVVLVSLCYFVWMFWVGVGGGQFALWLVFVIFACYLF